ncbi:hypothetical protein VNO77_09308 [Canavalia gladiata]|uniref:Response regulatory domain-containing protein n=1 Tax=Canavalia gladiata TaxID=3824 RepID=A0AAN9M945_CANGL
MGDEETVSHFSKNNLPPFNVNVLVVDDDVISLNITVGLLTSLNYQAVGTRHSLQALDKLRNHEGYFHLIVTEVHLPDLDGFKLKEIVDKEFGIPIIMISAYNNEEIQEKALRCGVLRYILKPAALDDFKGIWQFAVLGMKGKKPINTKIAGDFAEETSLGSMDHNKLNCSSFKKEERKVKGKSDVKRALMNALEDDGSSITKKAKVIWTNKLQSQFLKAINIIGLENAVPKRILQVMNVQGLTRENVASHLQKHRLFLRRVARMFAIVLDKANEEKDFLLCKMSSTYPSLMLKIIQEDLEKTLKQSGRRTSNLETNDAYISHLRYKLSLLLRIASNSQQYSYSKMNPYVKGGLSSSKINNLGFTNNRPKPRPHHPYPNHFNDAYQLRSDSNLLQKPFQNFPNSSSRLVGYNFNTLDLGQTSTSNFVNCNAATSFQGSIGSSQIQPNRNGVPNANHWNASMNDGSINIVTSAELVKPNSIGEGVSTTNKVHSINQSSPIRDTDSRNIVVENFYKPQQHHHQIYDQGYHQTSATKDNIFASQATSDGSHFEGIDDNYFSMESILKEVPMQDENKGDDMGEDTVPSDCAMHKATPNLTSTKYEDEAVSKDIPVDSNQYDDFFSSLDQFSSQVNPSSKLFAVTYVSMLSTVSANGTFHSLEAFHVWPTYHYYFIWEYKRNLKSLLLHRSKVDLEAIAETVENSSEKISASCEGNSIEEPNVGMEFESEETAKHFYDEYARREGFVVRLDRCHRSEVDNRIISRRFSCNKQGFHVRGRNGTKPVHKPRASIREGCEAMMLVKVNKCGKWVVSKFVKEHSHPLNASGFPTYNRMMESKDRKIQQLTQELEHRDRLCQRYRRLLLSLLETVEEETECLSRKVELVVNNVQQLENEVQKPLNTV